MDPQLQELTHSHYFEHNMNFHFALKNAPMDSILGIIRTFFIIQNNHSKTKFYYLISSTSSEKSNEQIYRKNKSIDFGPNNAAFT